MPIFRLETIDDSRLDVYRHLKKTNLTRWSGQFIAEGKKLTQQLLQSSFPVHSVLVSENYLGLIEPHTRPEHDILVVSQREIESVVGFNFHHGMLSCGIRLPEPSLEELLPPTGSLKVVVCPKLLLGNEDEGLALEWIDLCQRRATIPMAPQTDSLNVAFAACLFLYHFMG